MSHPVEPFGTENLKDDDGAVIDSFFVEVDNPPDLKMAETPITIPEPIEPTPTTRLIGGYIEFAAGAPVTMALPADKNRKNLVVRVVSKFATPDYRDAVFVADEQGKVAGWLGGSSANACPLYNGHAITPDNHTGALWVAPSPTIQGNIIVTWNAVTI